MLPSVPRPYPICYRPTGWAAVVRVAATDLGYLVASPQSLLKLVEVCQSSAPSNLMHYKGPR